MNSQDLETLKSFLDSSEPVFIDTETNYTDNDDERFLIGISVVSQNHGFYIPVGHQEGIAKTNNLQVPSDIFSLPKGDIVFHNCRFDLAVLQKAGIDICWDQVHDTMMMSHYCYEQTIPTFKNESGSKHGLDHLARFYNLTNKATEIAKSAKAIWNQLPTDIMAQYAVQDTVVTAELYFHLLDEYEQYRENWKERKYSDFDFAMFLSKMERKGLRVHRKRAKELEVQTESRIKEIDKELGFNPKKRDELHEKLFSDPPFGLGLVPLKYTPKTGKPQVNKDFLEKTNHPVCGLLLERSKLEKQLTSYFRPYQKLGDSESIIHPSFKQAGTVTGRLSCAKPNLQQVPRDSIVKTLFLPDEGYDLVEIDYSNLEMRLMAVYTQNKDLLETFSDRDGDVHQLTSDLIGVPRYDAKQANFTIGYGGGWEPLDLYIKKGEKVCRQIIIDWHKAYPEVRKAMRNAAAACEQNNGAVKLWTGRRRHFWHSREYHNAFNAVCQGGGFEIVKRSILMLDEAGFDIRNQVHDSVWINEKDPERVKEAERIMEDWVEDLFGLPFFVESKVLTSRK